MNTIYQEIGLTQAFLSKMPDNGVKIINWLIDQMRSKPSIKVSIEFLSDLFKVDRTTIQRWLRKFKEWGIIQKEQLYGIYCHNTITLNRTIFKYARYLKYQLTSLWDYLDFVYIRPSQQVTAAPYIEEKDINYIFHPLHPNLFINCGERSTTGDSQWGISYQEFVFNGNGEFERSEISGRQLENFIKILEEIEKKVETPTTKEQLFWDGLVKILKLSEHGKVKLQVFPTRIVSTAYKKLQQQNKVHDRVKWLIRECDNLCKAEGRPVQWGKYYDSLRSMGIDQSDSLTQEDTNQENLFDFKKPQHKEPEVYSTRDLSAQKKEINIETLGKGLSFLKELLPVEVQADIRSYINNKINPSV